VRCYSLQQWVCLVSRCIPPWADSVDSRRCLWHHSLRLRVQILSHRYWITFIQDAYLFSLRLCYLRIWFAQLSLSYWFYQLVFGIPDLFLIWMWFWRWLVSAFQSACFTDWLHTRLRSFWSAFAIFLYLYIYPDSLQGYGPSSILTWSVPVLCLWVALRCHHIWIAIDSTGLD